MIGWRTFLESRGWSPSDADEKPSNTSWYRNDDRTDNAAHSFEDVIALEMDRDD